MMRPKTVRVLLKAATRARQQGNWSALVSAGDALEREECFPEAWRCLADGGAIKARHTGRVHGTEWDGSAPDERRIAVVRLLRHVGAQLRMARVVGQLADQGACVTLCAEPRLHSLLARSFPHIAIVSEADTTRALGESDCWASYERIAQHLWDSPQAIAASFRPLVPDPALVERLRARYAVGNGPPLIGLSWYSTNDAKHVPSFADWAQLLKHLGGTIVSLQYAPEVAGIAVLEQAIGRPVINDPDIDSLTDLDGFAAQVMAADIIISISNTAAHLAGALGKRSVVFLDDKDHLVWPRGRPQTCFYPGTRLIRRNGRPWREAMEEALEVAGDAPASIP